MSTAEQRFGALHYLDEETGEWKPVSGVSLDLAAENARLREGVRRAITISEEAQSSHYNPELSDVLDELLSALRPLEGPGADQHAPSAD